MKLDSKILKDELDRLEKMTGTKTCCDILWTPKTESKIEGKVDDGTIYVYSCSLEEAMHTLRHEFFDILVSRTNEPYIKIINMLLSTIFEKVYEQKEDVVESLVRLAGFPVGAPFAKDDPAAV